MTDALRYVRVEFRYADPSAPGRLSDEHASIDAVIGPDDKIVGSWPLYGFWAADHEGEGKIVTYPMIVRPDGVAYCAPGDLLSTNVRDRPIRTGEVCTFWEDNLKGEGGGDEWPFRVHKVQVLCRGTK